MKAVCGCTLFNTERPSAGGGSGVRLPDVGRIPLGLLERLPDVGRSLLGLLVADSWLLTKIPVF